MKRPMHATSSILIVVAIATATIKCSLGFHVPLGWSRQRTTEVRTNEESVKVPSLKRSPPLSLLSSQSHSLLTTQLRSTYGRGAGIWPECNEATVLLSTSFPNGQIPSSALDILRETAQAEISSMTEDESSDDPNDAADATELASTSSSLSLPSSSSSSKRRIPTWSIRRILTRAAAREELDSEDQVPSIAIDRAPSLLVVSLILKGLIHPLDIVLVSCITAYVVILSMVAQSSRGIPNVPMLAALPPQGHVPSIVSTPLGETMTSSMAYDRWMKMGLSLGILGPVAMVAKYAYWDKAPALAGSCARPLFLLCFQAISEGFARRNLVPLPIRIFIPLMYNAVRMAYLWNWATSGLALGILGRALAVSNAVYWALNLFAFLIPIAALRYMRAHFFGVEAEEVKLRPGLEETIGLVPR